MVISLNAARAKGPPDGLDLLLECHSRIRTFSALSLGILAPDVEAPLVADGAARVHRYFSVALPLHVADEDVSLRARLRAVRHLQPLLDTLQQEHDRIERGLAELNGIWALLAEDPRPLEPRRGRLEVGTRAMVELLETHLQREEVELFPEVRQRLSPDELQALAGEIRQRRQPPAGSI